jgi:monoamine oxidase
MRSTEQWLKDWSTDASTATLANTVSAGGHATAPLAAPGDGQWQGRITGIASEWSALFPGHLAGTIDAAAGEARMLTTSITAGNALS